VELVVIAVVRACLVGYPQDFVDIIAVDEPCLLVVAGIGFPGAPGPLFAVIVAPAVGTCFGVDLFDAPAEGVVGVFSHVGIGAVLDPDDAVLVVIFVLVAVLVGGQVAGLVIAEAILGDFTVAVVVGINYVIFRPDSKVYSGVPVAEVVMGRTHVIILNVLGIRMDSHSALGLYAMSDQKYCCGNTTYHYAQNLSYGQTSKSHLIIPEKLQGESG